MNYKDLPYNETIRWVKKWRNPINQFMVMAIHYTADPNKDPERDWEEWVKDEKRWFPKDKWNKEYEIDFSSKSGQLVFGPEYCDFDSSIHFIDSIDVKWEMIFSLDFGQSNPNAAYVGVYDKDWVLYILDE